MVCLSLCKGSLINPRKHVVHPEDRVFNVGLISEHFDRSQEQRQSKTSYVLLTVKVKVLSVQTFTSNISLITNFHDSDYLVLVHVSAMIRDDTDDSLKELTRSTVFLLLLLELSISVQSIFRQVRRKHIQNSY